MDAISLLESPPSRSSSLPLRHLSSPPSPTGTFYSSGSDGDEIEQYLDLDIDDYAPNAPTQQLTISGSSQQTLCSTPVISKVTAAASASDDDPVYEEVPARLFSHYHKPYYTDICEILYYAFGHEDWRDGQLAAINSAIDGHDTFVMFPTGAGKSATYQVAGLYHPRNGTPQLTVVITPLLSLMKDQVAALISRRLKVLCLHSGQSLEVYDRIMALLTNPVSVPSFLYVTPERLFPQSGESRLLYCLQNRAAKGLISRIVVDEAQCILAWGTNFRSSYLKLGEIREKLPNIPIMALSASLGREDFVKTIKLLRMSPCKLISLHPDRRNLYYDVYPATNRLAALPKVIIDKDYSKSSCIVYCQLTKTCDEVSAHLRKEGLSARSYYGSMSEKDRDKAHRGWMDGSTSIIVATTAFGMGIDKPDVRLVVHWDMPRDIGSYYQETGRAGRDGQLSHCIIFFDPGLGNTRTRMTLLARDHFGGRTAAKKLFRPEELPCYSLTDYRTPQQQGEQYLLRTYQEQIAKPLYLVVRMCCDLVRCHRYYIMQFFGIEYAEDTTCRNCDVCSARISTNVKTFVKEYDVYDIGLCLLKTWKAIRAGNRQLPGRISATTIATVYRGHSQGRDGVGNPISIKNSTLRPVTLNFEPITTLPDGTEAGLNDIQRILAVMIINDVFWQVPVEEQKNMNWYLELGTKADEFARGGQLMVTFKRKIGPPSKKRKDKQRELPRRVPLANKRKIPVRSQPNPMHRAIPQRPYMRTHVHHDTPDSFRGNFSDILAAPPTHADSLASLTDEEPPVPFRRSLGPSPPRSNRRQYQTIVRTPSPIRPALTPMSLCSTPSPQSKSPTRPLSRNDPPPQTDVDISDAESYSASDEDRTMPVAADIVDSDNDY